MGLGAGQVTVSLLRLVQQLGAEASWRGQIAGGTQRACRLAADPRMVAKDRSDPLIMPQGRPPVVGRNLGYKGASVGQRRLLNERADGAIGLRFRVRAVAEHLRNVHGITMRRFAEALAGRLAHFRDAWCDGGAQARDFGCVIVEFVHCVGGWPGEELLGRIVSANEDNPTAKEILSA